MGKGGLFFTQKTAVGDSSTAGNEHFAREFSSRLDTATRLLSSRKSFLVELDTPDELVIVGDLHGDLPTLEKILNGIDSKKFLESSENKLVFLGDYIDRGKSSLGVLSILLGLQIRFPKSVVLIRGNHEAPNLFPFRAHNFPDEIRSRSLGDDTYSKVISFFDLLPLVTLIDQRIVMVHGGLPVETPELGSSSLSPREILFEAARNPRFTEQILWNDPKDEISGKLRWEKSRRSYGFHYSSEVTQRWLEALHARAMIRGHEPCEGFNILHDGQVMTLFSCKESYPKFGAAFAKIKRERIRSLTRATDLIPFVVPVSP